MICPCVYAQNAFACTLVDTRSMRSHLELAARVLAAAQGGVIEPSERALGDEAAALVQRHGIRGFGARLLCFQRPPEWLGAV